MGYIGYILYEGPSRLYSKDHIVVIMTGIFRNSINVKTGRMAQTWILRKDMDPHQASKNHKDDVICGDCPHRRNNGGGCYVNLRDPANVYKSYLNGRYKPIDWDEFKALKLQVRIGAYGDPLAAPLRIWKKVMSRSAGWTGYTHQAMSVPLPVRKNLKWLMISADTKEQCAKYHGLGLRTFRPVQNPDDLLPNEIMCPAGNLTSKGTKITCSTCMICGSSKSNKSVAVEIHGVAKKRLLKVIS